ncbi:hypothetical protein V1294_006038 [Bradyrhizobium sp. AZCC 1678]|uniref:hypothetical protein n=1 Tax=Bradyrhizobium sp. AZCC 1678 TaxID=3117030 RepID=UPI002FEF2247
MTTVGGSHAHFDVGAFTTGAAGGALSIAGALVAGIANYRAAVEANYDDWADAKLRAALRYSELMRAREQIMMGRLAQELTAAHDEIARLKRDHAVSAARALKR